MFVFKWLICSVLDKKKYLYILDFLRIFVIQKSNTMSN